VTIRFLSVFIVPQKKFLFDSRKQFFLHPVQNFVKNDRCEFYLVEANIPLRLYRFQTIIYLSPTGLRRLQVGAE
jgi:hypothetical protein